MRSLTRNGFSLLEVVLALAIFFASAAALSQLLLVGVKTARWTEHASEAALRCESKLAEIVAGLEPARLEPATPFDDDEHWEFEVEVVPTGVPASSVCNSMTCRSWERVACRFATGRPRRSRGPQSPKPSRSM